MDALTLDGSPVPVRPMEVQFEDRTHRETMFDGTGVSSRTGTATRARVWPMETPHGALTLSEAEDLLDDLRAPGEKTAGGRLIASSGTVEVLVRDIGYVDTAVQLRSVLFTLVEVDPDA